MSLFYQSTSYIPSDYKFITRDSVALTPCIVCGNRSNILHVIYGFEYHGVPACDACDDTVTEEINLFQEINGIFDLSSLTELHDLKIWHDETFTMSAKSIDCRWFNILLDSIGTTAIYNDSIYISVIRIDSIQSGQYTLEVVPLKKLLEFNNIDFNQLNLHENLTELLSRFDRSFIKFVD